MLPDISGEPAPFASRSQASAVASTERGLQTLGLQEAAMD